MSSGFGELTVLAHQLVAAGDLAGAQELLSDALADADPRPANASAELADAAGLHARVLVALGEPHSARVWAAFAQTAMNRLYGSSDQRTIAAAATLAAVLHRLGSYARAARLYQDVIIELTASDGPEALRVLAAHADLATVEFAQGACGIARSRLQDAWELHREVYGDGHASGIKMLARLGAMQRDCGHFTEAHEQLALARDLCRQHLSPDDPLAAQVGSLSRAAANPNHLCADTGSGDVNNNYYGRTSDHGSGDESPQQPGVPTARTPLPPDETVGPEATGSGASPTENRTDTDRPAAAPTATDWPLTPTTPAGASFAGAGPTTVVPTPRAPVEPPRTAAVTTPETGGPEQRWWPPEDDSDHSAQPGWRTGTTPTTISSADAVPDRLATPGDTPDGVRQVSHLPARYHYSRLPVPVHRPPAHPVNRMAPFAVAGVTVLLLGAAAVIVGVAKFDESAGTPGTPATVSPVASPSAPAAAQSPGAPPTGAKLRDNQSNIVLTWKYPTGSEGPVVISGGESGQELRLFEQLPAGTDRYVVHELSPDTDYCFTIAVVYSADVVARTKPVCTDRG